MSYLAIARKWRPLAFDEIVGQQHVTRTLHNAIRMGRIHHAFLFTGPRGVGKTTAARVLARAMCCEHGPTPEPCGECVLCTSILAGSAPDVIEIDGASNNSVDDIRDLREGVRYLPSQARYRLYIIDEVHMLTRQAFNALLKTLEEPPPHVAFVFATTEPQKIPETILSRVQRFDFKRIPGSQVAGRLRAICDAEGVTVSDHALRLVARAGEGSMRDAQSLLDQVISFSGLEVDDAQVTELLGLVDRSLLYEMLGGLVGGEPARCLDAIAQVHDHGFEIDLFTGELLELLRNAALVALAPEARRHLDLSDDELARLEELAKGLSPEIFARWFDALLEVHDRVARASRPRMVLEMAVARLASIRPVLGMDRVLARLEDLDRRLRHGGVKAPRGGGARGGPPFQGSGREGRSTPSSPPRSFGDAAPAAPRRVEPRKSSAPATAPPAAPRRVEPRKSSAPATPPPAAPVERPPAVPEPSSRRKPPKPAPAVATPSPPPATRVGPRPPRAARRPVERPDTPVLPMPSVGPDGDANARYQAVLDVLSDLDVTWGSLVEHSVGLSWSGDDLKVAFSTAFQLEQGRPRLQSPELRPVLERAFPGMQRVEPVLRESSQGRPVTRHEVRKAARERYLQKLRREVEHDPVIRALRDDLGLELVSFEPTDTTESTS